MVSVWFRHDPYGNYQEKQTIEVQYWKGRLHFCVCPISQAKLLHHHCKLSDQCGLSARVFRVQYDPFVPVAPGSALYSVIPYVAPLLKQMGWVSSRQSSSSGAWKRTLPSPLHECFRTFTSAVGSLWWSRIIPDITPACGGCMKPEIILT